jgi:hypothetical protein
VIRAPVRSASRPNSASGADKLAPADRRDLAVSIAFALTGGSRRAKGQSADVLARIVAERVVEAA